MEKIFDIKNDCVLVFIISLFFCVLGSGNYPIYILDEAKNAEAAREMLENLDFIVPTFNNVLRTDKPPLHYYFMQLGYSIFGVNPFGARFFSGIFGAFTLLVTFFFIKKYENTTTAWVTILCAWSAVFFIQEFHLAVPDPYLIFFVSSGIWLFYDFYKLGNKKSLWLMYMCFGFGVLTKGPVAIALPGLIFLLFLIFQKQFVVKTILSYRPFIGILLVLLVCLPWYILVHLQTAGEWTHGFFVGHNLNRFGSKMEGHGGVFLITWAFVLLGLMPFSFFTPFALLKAFKYKQHSFVFFAFLASVVFIAFFSISATKLPNYTMPCYPFLAFLIGRSLVQFYEKPTQKLHVKIVVVIIGVLALFLPIGGKIALQNEPALEHVSTMAFWLIPTSVVTLIGVVFFFKNELKKAFLTVSVGWIILIPTLFLIIYPVIAKENPIAQAKMIIPNKNKVGIYKRFDAALPINFKKTYPVFQSLEQVNAFFKKYPDGFLVTNAKNFDKLKDHKDLVLVFERKAIFESHTTRVYKRK